MEDLSKQSVEGVAWIIVKLEVRVSKKELLAKGTRRLGNCKSMAKRIVRGHQGCRWRTVQ